MTARRRRALGMADVTGEFEITIPGGPMVCGYCGETERWRSLPLQTRSGEGQSTVATHLALGYVQLTGFHCLGVGREGELVVLAEATTVRGKTIHLPHLCEAIPDSAYEEYAADIAAMLRDQPVGATP